jgi:hypothetical protein
MTTLIAGLALLSSFICLAVLEYLPSELDKMKASFAIGITYLLGAVCIYSGGLIVAFLEFNR